MTAANTDHTADSPADWVRVARSKHNHYKTLRDRYEAGTVTADVAIRVHERTLAGMVPHLTDAVDRNRDIGYVAGLRKAHDWLRWMASSPADAGLDPATMVRLVEGAAAMAKSAADRLSVGLTETEVAG